MASEMYSPKYIRNDLPFLSLSLLSWPLKSPRIQDKMEKSYDDLTPQGRPVEDTRYANSSMAPNSQEKREEEECCESETNAREEIDKK